MSEPTTPLGSHMPEGVRFTGAAPGAVPGWAPGLHPTEDDIATCVTCGLCLPHCPTYRLTLEESASPRGRITAMRAIAEGRAEPDSTFRDFTDLCLTCRACEEVCPSDVPFGRMMESARAQVEPARPVPQRLMRRAGLSFALRHNRILDLMAVLTPVVRPMMPRRIRTLIPRTRLGRGASRLPHVTEPEGSPRGTVALLSGCVQDRWFREVNLATIRVLARNGWRVVVPPDQGCCGALSAHYGYPDAARRMARRNLKTFSSADHVISNSAGCSAHMKDYGHLLGDAPWAADAATRVRDLMEFLHETGIEPPTANAGIPRVAYHDACHASHAQGIRAQPRDLLRLIPGLEVVEIPDGGTCCGAAGLYNVFQPAPAAQLGSAKASNIASTGVAVVVSANPGCSMQIEAQMRERGQDVTVLHPVQLLDSAYDAGAGEAPLPA